MKIKIEIDSGMISPREYAVRTIAKEIVKTGIKEKQIWYHAGYSKGQGNCRQSKGDNAVLIKDEIREDMRAKRRALSKDEVKIKSDEIRQRLLGVGRVKQAKTICTFISAFKEPDTVEIIKELWEQDKKIVVIS